MFRFNELRCIILLFFFVTIFHNEPVRSQTSYADSLRNLITSLPDNREKADNLVLFARHFLNISVDTMGSRSQQAYDLAKSLDYGASLAEASIMLGIYYRSKSDLDQSIYYSTLAFHIGDSLNLKRVVAKSALNTGSTMINTGDLNESVKYCRIGLRAFTDLNDSASMIASYSNLGLAFHNKSMYDSAAYFFDQGIRISEKTVKKPYISYLYYNLSDVYRALEDLDQAKKYALLAFELRRQSGDKRSLGLSYNQIGIIERRMGNYNEAIRNYDLSAKILAEVGDSLRLVDTWNNMGLLYRNQKRYDEAGKYYDRALAAYQAMGYQNGVFTVMNNQADLLRELGKYTQSIEICKKILEQASASEMRKNRLMALNNLMENYKILGDFRNAFEYQSRYYALNDSIFSLEKEELIKDLAFKYEKGQDQARILTLENENLAKDLVLKKKTLQRNAFLYAGLTIIALGIFLFLYIHQRRVKDRIISDQKIKQLEEEKKLMAAKLLVEGQEVERKRIATELHDGLGVLLSATKMQFSTILDKSPESRDLIEKATKMLEQASGDVRKISHNMMPGLLTKLGFYEAVEDLFEHLDDSGKLTADCSITGERARLAENREIMLYRIIQEMVNNTIKHAEAKNVSLHIHILPDMLDIMFSDDGKGFDFEKMLESQSLGLKSIQSRVSFLNGELHFESAPSKGTRYNMRIPV